MRKIALLLVLVILATSLVGCGTLINLVSGKLTGSLEGDEMPFTNEQVEENLNKLVKNGGYSVAFTYENGEGDEGSALVGVTEDKAWYIPTNDSGEGKAAWTKDGKTHFFDYDQESKTWTFSHSVDDEDGSTRSSVMGVYTTLMAYGNTLEGIMKKGKDAKVAGRDCYTYSFSLSGILGAIGKAAGVSDLSYTLYIDKELGITLKNDFSAESGQESSTMKFTTTEFLTGKDVKVPSLPNPDLS